MPPSSVSLAKNSLPSLVVSFCACRQLKPVALSTSQLDSTSNRQLDPTSNRCSKRQVREGGHDARIRPTSRAGMALLQHS